MAGASRTGHSLGVRRGLETLAGGIPAKLHQSVCDRQRCYASLRASIFPSIWSPKGEQVHLSGRSWLRGRPRRQPRRAARKAWTAKPLRQAVGAAGAAAALCALSRRDAKHRDGLRALPRRTPSAPRRRRAPMVGRASKPEIKERLGVKSPRRARLGASSSPRLNNQAFAADGHVGL